VQTYNILKDLHIRDMMALCKKCTTFSDIFGSALLKMGTQNILKDLYFSEMMVFSWKMKNVKEGCLVIR
jgi:3-deoxy-D-manno-octulosonic-acid transferase